MSPSKNLYIADADVPVWERAEKAAADARTSLSKIVVEALEKTLPADIRVVVEPEPGSITFDEVNTPILEFGDHPPYGSGWLLSYLEGNGVEVKFFVGGRSEPPPVRQAREYLEQVRRDASVLDMEEIVVDLGDRGRTWRESFVGRWLTYENASTEVLGIALTKRGKFALYTYNEVHSVGSLDVYDSLAELGEENPRFPEEMVAEAAGELGEDYVIRRDI